MFDNLEPNQGVPSPSANPTQPTASFPPQAKVDDIFAGVKEVALPNSKNGQSSPPLKVANRPQGSSGGFLKMLIIIIVFLILAIVGLVVASRYFGFDGLSQFLPQEEKSKLQAEKITTTPDPVVEPIKENNVPSSGMPGVIEEVVVATTTVVEQIASSVPTIVPTTSPALVVTSTLIEKASDIDGDGLSDEQEVLLGTNPNKPDTDGDGLLDGEEVNTYKTSPLKVDTDNDGLSDFDEVKVYLTNPNNPDTDADTFLDGEEVEGGYNPKGPGKLVK